jgi:hypothetical protein
MTEICRACGILTGTFFVLGCSGLAFARDDDSYTSLLDYFYGYWERWGAMNPDWGKVFANEREAPDRYLKGISIGALTTGLVGLSVLAVYHCFFAKPRCSITCCKLN